MQFLWIKHKLRLWFPFQQRKALHHSQICHIIPMNTTRTPMPLKLTFLRLWQS